MSYKVFTNEEKSILAFKAAQIANQEERFGGNYYDDFNNVRNNLILYPLLLSTDGYRGGEEEKRLTDAHIDLHIHFLKIAYMLGIQDEYLERIKKGMKLTDIRTSFDCYTNDTFANTIYCTKYTSYYMVQHIKSRLLFSFLYEVILDHKDEILKAVNEEFSDLLEDTVYEVTLSNLDDFYFKDSNGLPLFVLKRRSDIEVDSDEYKRLVDRSFLLYNSFCRTEESENDGYHFIMFKLYSEHSGCNISATNLTILRPDTYSYY